MPLSFIIPRACRPPSAPRRHEAIRVIPRPGIIGLLINWQELAAPSGFTPAIHNARRPRRFASRATTRTARKG